ncbi:MAG TPA: cation:proton antiporter, partial [Candidatus Thermoplasmatota archaeon]|nr:cation:proton antiporter [Candidatus Thermoplasmatota archaeon]
MSELDVAVALVGLIVVVTALVSRPLERLPVSRPLVALGVGVALGPAALGLLDAHAWHPSRDVLVREVSRLTIAIGLMAVALRLPRGWFRAHWRPVSLLLLVLMPLMWLATSAVVRLVLGFDWWTSLLIGAVLTPTDPVAASAIVTGPLAKKALPERLRHLLSAESGANDGLALPLVMIGILVLTKPMESAVHEWLTHVLLVEVLLGAVIGLALGLVVGRAFRWADEHKDMEVSSFLAVTLALALLALGAAKLAGGSGVLAVFVAGIAFDSQTRSKERHEEEKIQEAVNLLFTVPAFGLLGLLLPWNEWLAMGPAALAAVVLILLLRR